MTLHRCDICEKKISSDLKSAITVSAAGFGEDFFSRVFLCPECAKPVLTVLDQHGLLRLKRKS